MLLYLIQHAKPISKEEDSARPLSEEGRADAEIIANRLKGLTVAAVYDSGKLRASQTAQILSAAMQSHTKSTTGLDPLDDPEIWAERLMDMEDDLMLVGHMPHMGKLASLLLCGRADTGIVEFQQGAVLCLKRTEGKWAVQWMIVPEVV